MSTNTKKLRVLRSRTDHDLLVLVQRDLDRGFTLVDLATTRNSPLFAHAEKAYQGAATLLSKISALPEDDRLRIEGKVKHLRLRLDQVPSLAKLERYPASFAS
ncbi:MAG TPA: hypothetical protein VGZ73_30235 [Bryobacteraceae bacterium]|jgi:hypothetical protein|nr:hypothetical protein [Bryobacteraceae bacterium]